MTSNASQSPVLRMRHYEQTSEISFSINSKSVRLTNMRKRITTAASVDASPAKPSKARPIPSPYESHTRVAGSLVASVSMSLVEGKGQSHHGGNRYQFHISLSACLDSVHAESRGLYRVFTSTASCSISGVPWFLDRISMAPYPRSSHSLTEALF